jgi:hypothetical protein
MVREVDREDQLAAARRVPANVVVQLPDAEPPPAYVPAPKSMMTSNEGTPTQPATNGKVETPAAATLATASPINLPRPSNALANALAQLTNEAPPVPTTLVNKLTSAPRTIEVAQPLNAPSTTVATEKVEAAKVEAAPDDSTKNKAGAGGSSVSEKLKTGLFGKPAAAPSAPAMPTVEARLVPGGQEMAVGEKRRVALVLISKERLGNVIARLRFDPRVLAVRGISQGVWPDGAQSQPTIMQSIDPAGLVTLAISPQANAPLQSGANVVLYLEIESLAAGESAITFDENAQAITSDGRSVKLQTTEGRMTVK